MKKNFERRKPLITLCLQTLAAYVLRDVLALVVLTRSFNRFLRFSRCFSVFPVVYKPIPKTKIDHFDFLENFQLMLFEMKETRHAD